MRLALERAGEADAAAIAALRLAAARELTAQFGQGVWSFAAESEGGVRLEAGSGNLYLARDAGTVIASLRLSPRKPWLIAADFFSPAARPAYLTSMAVTPARQTQGVGRACLDAAREIAAAAGHDAIRLDSYNAPAGAGTFYRKCGFLEVCRATYHGTSLIFFETRLTSPPCG
jgi:GNAT superfamily N-acetyltransferase